MKETKWKRQTKKMYTNKYMYLHHVSYQFVYLNFMKKRTHKDGLYSETFIALPELC